jgi:hypothetical protein
MNLKRKQFEIIDTTATEADDVKVDGGFFSRGAAQAECDILNSEWCAQKQVKGTGPYFVKPVRKEK